MKRRIAPLLWWVAPLLWWVATLLLLLLLLLLPSAILLSNASLDSLNIILHTLLDTVVLGVGVAGAQLELVQLLAQREAVQGPLLASAGKL